MKKLGLVVAVLMISVISHAQEPEKKKSSPPPSRGQERAINEIGISVKSDPKKTSKAKTSQPVVPKEKKQTAEKSLTKKPE
ncbi:MAG: hypothetical protein V4565_10755 [Bacteroidota bacterium]